MFQKDQQFLNLLKIIRYMVIYYYGLQHIQVSPASGVLLRGLSDFAWNGPTQLYLKCILLYFVYNVYNVHLLEI